LDEIRSPRIVAAIARAFEQGETTDLLGELARASGLPGPRPNLDLARSMATRLAVRGRASGALVDALLASKHEFHSIVSAIALAERAMAGIDAKASMARLHDMAADERQAVRAGVIEAVRVMLLARGAAAVTELAAWTDGYLHAHVVLEAIADRTLLTRISAETEVLARLDEAFALADVSPRAAERTQGVRTLRRALPAQIATIADRYPATLAWLAERAAAERPETREVVEETIRALRKHNLALSEVDRLTRALADSAPKPRDPSRIVQGTRKRSKGRR